MAGFQNFFVNGLAALRQVAGDPVTYRRGSDSVVLSATVGKTTINFFDRNNIQTVVDSRDFLVTAADLKVSDVAILPEVGDLIIDAAGNTYKVLDLQGEPSYRFSDALNSSLRIHTKLVETD